MPYSIILILALALALAMPRGCLLTLFLLRLLLQ